MLKYNNFMYQYPKCSTALLHTLLLVVPNLIKEYSLTTIVKSLKPIAIATVCGISMVMQPLLCSVTKHCWKEYMGKGEGMDGWRQLRPFFHTKIRNPTKNFLPMYAKRWSLKHHFQAVGLDGIKLVLQVCQLLLLPLLVDVHDDLCGKGWCK